MDYLAANNIFVKTFMVGSGNFCLFLQEWRFSRSRSSKVIHVGTDRKRVCYFLLAHNSHRCDKRLQRLQKNFCKRVYYFVHVYLNTFISQ